MIEEGEAKSDSAAKVNTLVVHIMDNRFVNKRLKSLSKMVHDLQD